MSENKKGSGGAIEEMDPLDEKSLRDKLMSLPIPKGGIRGDMGDDRVFILKPFSRAVYTMTKQLLREGKDTEAAIAALNTLKLPECPNPIEFEQDVAFCRAAEELITLHLPVYELEIKKN